MDPEGRGEGRKRAEAGVDGGQTLLLGEEKGRGDES